MKKIQNYDFEILKSIPFKKAQVTIFIVLGIVIVILAAMFFILAPALGVNLFSNPSNVESYAGECFDSAAACTLFNLGANNAHIQFSQSFPSIEEIKTEIAPYFSENSLKCQDFAKFKEMDITASQPVPFFSFNSQDTSIITEQKITVKRADQTNEFDRFTTKLPVRFANSYELAAKLRKHNLTLISQEYIDLGLLEDDSIIASVYEKAPHVISLTDKKSTIKDNLYKFIFVKPIS